MKFILMKNDRLKFQNKIVLEYDAMKCNWIHWIVCFYYLYGQKKALHINCVSILSHLTSLAIDQHNPGKAFW